MLINPPCLECALTHTEHRIQRCQRIIAAIEATLDELILATTYLCKILFEDRSRARKYISVSITTAFPTCDSEIWPLGGSPLILRKRGSGQRYDQQRVQVVVTRAALLVLDTVAHDVSTRTGFVLPQVETRCGDATLFSDGANDMTLTKSTLTPRLRDHHFDYRCAWLNGKEWRRRSERTP